MNNSIKFSAIFITFFFLLLVIVGFQEVKAVVASDDLELPMMQNQTSTGTPTITNTPPNQTAVTPTPIITATLALESFPTITLIFPELSSSDTPTASATKELDKGVPLSMISSNTPPAGKPGLIYAVIILWLILIIFAIFIARKAYHLWFE